MQAGALNRRIRIDRGILTRDGLGGEVRTWQPLTTVWAAMTQISDGERMRADERAAELSARFVIRWSLLAASIDPQDRVIYAGKTHHIFAVKELGFREGIEITAGARAETP